MRTRHLKGCGAVVALSALLGCSSGSDSPAGMPAPTPTMTMSAPMPTMTAPAPKPRILPLDISQPHYGKTYAEWGSEWWIWVYNFDVAGSRCDSPVSDTTGALCAVSQDPSSPVFFLTASWGGKVIRSQCVVPAGKALFFPILDTISGDGDPSRAAENKATINADVAVMTPSSLKLEVDGEEVPTPALARLRVDATLFSFIEVAPPNFFTCTGGPPEWGPILDSCHGGYYVLLPPLSKGSHKLRFQGSVASIPPFSTDITYDPLVVQ